MENQRLVTDLTGLFSTCPFLSKALDMYVYDLYISQWNLLEASTQYQGSQAHKLAALLVTELVQQSKAQKLPLFLLYLDVRSVFDIGVTEFLLRYLYS